MLSWLASSYTAFGLVLSVIVHFVQFVQLVQLAFIILVSVHGTAFLPPPFAPLPAHHLLRVVAGEASRRFRAARVHPGPAGDRCQARAVSRLSS